MLLVKPSCEILNITLLPLQLIEIAGRTCYKSEAKIKPDTSEAFTDMILRRGHESVVEHACATVKIICDRGVSHEIVRHRLASYSQESTRYCDYNRGHVSFIIPPWVVVEPGEYPVRNDQYKTKNPDDIWFLTVRAAESAYIRLREQGWKPEQARSVLPNSLKTELVMTTNFREWRHFFKLRTAPTAHPQMREIAIPLLRMMKAEIPVIFDDIGN